MDNIFNLTEEQKKLINLSEKLLDKNSVFYYAGSTPSPPSPTTGGSTSTSS